jgi:Uma2 family endonuclease
MSAITVDTRLIGGMFREYTPKLKLDFGKKAKKLSDEDFFEFCRENADLRIEMDKNGDIEIMPPTGSETGIKNFKLTGKFWVWVEKDGTGEGFDSSTGFRLPNGAKRSPDLSWVRLEKWNKISPAKRKKFAPLCPDFVIEIRSETDSLEKLQAKMTEYIENGASLGWLIDVKNKKVYVYRPNAEIEVLDNPTEISGEPILKGFTLNLNEIWS